MGSRKEKKEQYTEKMIDEKFLSLEHKKLYPYLIQLFNEKKNCFKCFLHQEYNTVGMIGIQVKHGVLD